jgi:hypothetical protein
MNTYSEKYISLEAQGRREWTKEKPDNPDPWFDSCIVPARLKVTGLLPQLNPSSQEKIGTNLSKRLIPTGDANEDRTIRAVRMPIATYSKWKIFMRPQKMWRSLAPENKSRCYGKIRMWHN